MKYQKPSTPVIIASTVIFTAILIGVMAFFVKVFDAKPYRAPVVLDRNYDHSAMQAALTPEAVQARYDQIHALGSRGPGQKGLADTADLIEKTFRDAGLEVISQRVDIPYPLTEGGHGTLAFGADGEGASINVWPFKPNYTQPVVTPPEGVRGTLFLVNEENVRAETDFTDKIAVVDMSQPLFKQLETNPAQFRELGFPAVIITHAEGLENAPWPDLISSMAVDMPINLVRVAAEPEVLSHIGEKAVLKARSRWINARTRNIVGVLRAKEKTDLAVVIPVTYDAASVLPDHADGPVQALQTSLLLQLLQGILPHRDALKRDVIFIGLTGVSQQLYGASRLLSTIGTYGTTEAMGVRIQGEIAENDNHVRLLKEILALFDDPAFASDPAATDAKIKALAPDVRRLLTDRAGAVMRRAVFNQAEVLLQAEITFKRNPDDLTSPEYHAFRREKKRYDDLNNMSALPLPRALERAMASTKSFELSDGTLSGLREALVSHIGFLLDFHAERAKTLNEDLQLQRLFSAYSSITGVSPRLHPVLPTATAAGDANLENVSYAVGTFLEANSNTGEAAALFYAMMNDSVYAIGLQDKVNLTKATGTAPYGGTLGGAPFDSTPWGVVSLPVFSVCTPRNSAKSFQHPFTQPEYTNLVSIQSTMQVLGETVIAAGRGYGNFPRLPFISTYSYHGCVYASGIGNSTVPNYAMADTLVAAQDQKPFRFTNPYGNYGEPFLTMPTYSWTRNKGPQAFHFGSDGIIDYVKDTGISAQRIYASMGMPTTDVPVNLILYRATPVAILNTVNPQSMKSFTSIAFISRTGLAAFGSTCPYTGAAGMMDFLPPSAYFFLTLKAGAPGNDLVATTRAFCLGVRHNDEPHYKPTDNEIDGAGYLAQDTPFFPDITLEAASSMAWLAGKRLDLQKRYGMADEMTLGLDEDANTIVANDDTAKKTRRPLLERLRNLRQALSYLILNHPVIRGSVSEAVWGILWYMGLLVPFIFFFEKLVFGFTDIRRQLLAEGAIFLVVFALLRILHPAFHMIRSSAMILLGFIIILIVGSVTIVLSGKFQENIDALRRAQGGVKGAHVNKAGIIMTAFMLGLNNMHKRKVRTGLTCATLVLMTFVMICFTSVQSNIVEKERAIGRAAYQGILVREKQFRPIAEAEISALNATYGEDHTVNVRYSYVGLIDGNGIPKVPNFEVLAGEGDNAIMRTVKCGITFSHTEPLRDSIRMLTTNGWFTAEQSLLTTGPYPVIISDDTAEQLGIYPEDVNKAPVPVTINGGKYYVWNIFDSSDLFNVTDVDGENLIPFDVEGITSPQMVNKMVLAEDTDPRVQPTDLLFGLHNKLPLAEAMMRRATSVVVDMGTTPYQKVRSEINAYLIQTGRDCCYGLDGTAFNGRRARTRSMAGIADLLIPLIIAALTVLNTMKGSVYERRDEIYVYNAVGIAPRYIFFIFVAEALVYSVVGAVLGYILSQGTGRILTALDMTGGMNMNFTSVTTIYASLAIAGATLASTYFPAKSAMEIAKPADNAGWTLPKPDDDDRIVFMLPFTFTQYDRIAVLAFFYKYFENHGEGSAGPFFSGVPVLKVAEHTDPLANDSYIPSLEVQVWLKPFDLGVSQKIIIELGTDPDTKEYISKMILERVTGTRDAWLRLNGPLVALIRQHFLHWRAVPQDQKTELFAEAKALLEENELGA